MRVSILVLMEDVKEQKVANLQGWQLQDVSILVLMEDVKEPADVTIEAEYGAEGFNPCFNGRCKRTNCI